MTFTSEELNIIKSSSKFIKIDAPSGYAKTYTMIHKCLKFIKQNNEVKVLYIVDTTSSKHIVTELFKMYIKKYFNKYKSKTKLLQISIKTSEDLAFENVKKQYGTFILEDFNYIDIYKYLNLIHPNNYTKTNCVDIMKRLHDFYSNSHNINTLLQEEIQTCDDEEEQNILHIYKGIIYILQAQRDLMFKININTCMKFYSLLNQSKQYKDMIIIDDAQNINKIIYKNFLNIKSNIKILCGDSLKPTSKTNINALTIKQYHETFILNKSYRLLKDSKHICEVIKNKIMPNLHLKYISNNKSTISGNLNNKNSILIFNYKVNILDSIIKNSVENKTFFMDENFEDLFIEFIAICYIKLNKITNNTEKLQQQINNFLQFKTIENFIETSDNTNLKHYYHIFSTWLNNNIDIQSMLIKILSNQTNQENAHTRYALIDNVACYEYDFVFIAKDFIKYRDISNPNKIQLYELQKLYLAISRAKKEFYVL
jgi:hypothetical protein